MYVGQAFQPDACAENAVSDPVRPESLTYIRLIIAPRFAEEISMSTGQFASSASAIFQRFLNEVRETARLTASHIVGLKQYGVAEWQSRRLSGKAFDAQAALGERMHQAGQGDAAQRARIAEVEERLRSLKAAQTKSKDTELELKAEQARLA